MSNRARGIPARAAHHDARCADRDGRAGIKLWTSSQNRWFTSQLQS